VSVKQVKITSTYVLVVLIWKRGGAWC